MKPIFLRAVVMALTALTVSAHSPGPNVSGQSSTPNQGGKGKAGERRASSIKGRVVNEAGQPIANAIVRAVLIGKRGAFRSTNTDDEGRFSVEELTRGIYSVLTYAPGYTNLEAVTEMKFCRVGDTVNFAMTKGGVITGTVTDSSGEPLVAVRVSAIRVRDLDGRAPRTPVQGGEQRTDDRGVYRIYGLMPGTYVVLASGNNSPFYQPTAYDEDVPTYHPSSTRDTAAPVTVQQGAELTGIDIRYRGERGHAVSGNIADTLAVNPNATLLLLQISSNQIIGQQFINGRGGNDASAFAFYGVPDGEYYVIARRFGGDDQEAGGAGNVRIKVKGADVTGLRVSVTPHGSIAGRIAVERLGAAEQKDKCESKQIFSFEESLISASRDKKTDNRDEPFSPFTSSPLAVPTDKGEFTMNGIEAGRYYIEARSISEDWYIRAVTQPAAVQGKPPIDAGRSGLTIKPGERLTGVTVTMAEGAASLRGRIVPAAEGARLPDRLRVHIIPAEKEAADDALRFAEAAVQSDGAFSLKNIAPGRYSLVARPVPDEEADERSPRPMAWDAEGRKILRQESETTNVNLELQPCQRVSDHVLRYAPALAKPSPKRKP